ncbi:MAG: hypothetical protein ACTSYR_02175 [Candidatus Odinarchaeia archaeon]
MSATRRFSVGRFKMGDKILATCQDITVRFDGGAVELHADGFYDPVEVELGNRTTTITVRYAEWADDIDVTDVLTNEYITIELLPSPENANRGIKPFNLTRCKAVSWEITSSQDAFVTYSMEFRKARSS